MDACDVLIVGGGPAGSSCARVLSAADLDVVVLDRARFPRDKVCAGWITPAVVDELELDLSDYAHGRVLQPITGFRTGLIGGSLLTTTYDRPVSYGIRRCEFDHYLLERSGARLDLGTALASLRRDGDRWIANDRVAAPLVVGAGGHFCPVARMTTEKRPEGEVVVLAQEIEFEMTPEQRAACRVDERVPELFFCEDLKGYAWCFRKGNFLNIGLGREGETRLSEHVEAFFRSLVDLGRIGPGTVPRFHGHAYRLYLGPPRKIVAENVLLIGDAAGLAYPQSGEGIRPAIESGLLAAETILETPRERRSELPDRLRRKLSNRFGEPPRPPARRGPLASKLRGFVARRLLMSRWFARRVLIERWFLHVHQPSLRIAPPRGTSLPPR